MDASLEGDVVRAGREARERFYDSRGYGRSVEGDLELAPVEAAHLLARGDIDVVDGRDFRAFLASAAVSEVAYLVYADLRDRGFYCSPAREGWGPDGLGIDRGAAGPDFLVYPRGQGPWDGEVAYRIRVVSERADVAPAALLDLADRPGDGDAAGTGDAGDAGDGVLAVVDEESELTYLGCARPTLTGSTHHDLPADVEAELLSDRVAVWDAPDVIHQRAFYGQELDAGDLQLSLVEAAYLARQGVLALEAGEEGVVDLGRSVEGERFDRRLRVYAALRSAGIVPKTGFKFGADFRTYADVERVSDLGHSERLVRVLRADATLEPRDLALDVRLAHGVRKTMVYALTGASGDIDWLEVTRLTP